MIIFLWQDSNLRLLAYNVGKVTQKRLLVQIPLRDFFVILNLFCFFFGLNWTTKIGPTLVLFWLTLFSIAVAQKCIQWRKMEVQKVLLGIDAYRMPKKILCYQQTIQKNTTTWEDVPKTTLRSTVNHTHTVRKLQFWSKSSTFGKTIHQWIGFFEPILP